MVKRKYFVALTEKEFSYLKTKVKEKPLDNFDPVVRSNLLKKFSKAIDFI